MSESYACPRCGAVDSGFCAFPVNNVRGTVIVVKQDEARAAGCRVMHFTDKRAAVARS